MRKFPLAVLHTYFVFSLLIGIAVLFLRYKAIAAPTWVYSYLNDFLIIPIVGTIALNAVWIFKKDKTIRLSPFSILTLVLIYSISFEYYLPQITNYYVADVGDVICYAMGGVVFYILQKIERGKYTFSFLRSRGNHNM